MRSDALLVCSRAWVWKHEVSAECSVSGVLVMDLKI